MNKRLMRAAKRPTSGFTLIELLVVVLIIGILAAIAVPQYFKVVEKGKAAEAIQWIQVLKSAQERYLAKNGNYATNVTSFDVSMGGLKNYNSSVPGTSSDASGPRWTIGLPRNAAPAVYGSYTIQYSVGGSYGGGSFSCTNSACVTDLLP